MQEQELLAYFFKLAIVSANAGLRSDASYAVLLDIAAESPAAISSSCRFIDRTAPGSHAFNASI
jgi:hypothetical protein